MGYWKDKEIEESERGYRSSIKSICQECIGDKYLKQYIHDNGAIGDCSFCRCSNVCVLPFDEFMKPIMQMRNEYFGNEWDYGMYDSETKDYLNEGVWFSDFILDYIGDVSSEFVCELRSVLIDDVVYSNDGFVERLSEIELELWNDFCSYIKKCSEKNILSILENIKQSKFYGLLENILYCIEENKCIVKLPKDTPIYRVRNVLEEIYICAKSIGTPPTNNVRENRMNTAKDPMFYGSFEKNTAWEEATGKMDKGKSYIGMFNFNQEVRILDLSKLSKDNLPSIFDVKNIDKREQWEFLYEFERLISLPISDNYVSKNYKPTQVFTKYIQYDLDVQGIMYKSSKCEGGRNIVLFVDNEHCVDTGTDIDNTKCYLILQSYEEKDEKW